LSREQLSCRIRKISVSATPEELVRQSLLTWMIEKQGYPPENLAIEKGLHQMPHFSVSSEGVPERRADIVCFSKDIHPSYSLYPLLLIECKATDLSSKVKNQIIGYNHHLKAFFVSIANQQEIQTGWYDLSSKQYRFISGLPPYDSLLSSLTRVQ
jgi:hypothetical protein